MSKHNEFSVNSNELLEILKMDEDINLEFKENFGDNTLKTISAFSNTDGGTLIIGVNKHKKITGMQLKDNNYQNIVNQIVNKLSITPEFKVINIDDKKVLIINVRKSSIPVSFDGRYYKRVGNTTREMTFEDLKSYFRKDLRWERLKEKDFTFDEIDESNVKNFLSIAKSKDRLSVLNFNMPIEEIFEKLGLSENGKINNAGILLFGKEVQKYFNYAKVRVVKLKDNITIVSDRWIEGNLFNQFAETVETIKNFISVRYEIKGIERKEIWDYPLEAIREAVANALLHRDYFTANNIQIKIYDDRIWFYNPGGLPEGWSLEKLLDLHCSAARNLIMFYVFYLAGFVENIGSGIERMIKTLSDYKLPHPKFEANHTEFSLLFFKDVYTEEYLAKLNFNERQIKAVMYVKEKGKITNREYREMFNITDRTALNDLKSLCDKGLLKKIGKTGRSTEYILAEINPKNTKQTRNKPEKHEIG
ncbi:MAG TPA: ATP-binding protein [bacterium]|nr:ATP-binding protein [bacterium]